MRNVTLAAALAICAAAEIASADAAVLVVSKSIQTALNAAKPGDTIFVPPGTYRETVWVLKDNITCRRCLLATGRRSSKPTTC